MLFEQHQIGRLRPRIHLRRYLDAEVIDDRLVELASVLPLSYPPGAPRQRFLSPFGGSFPEMMSGPPLPDFCFI